jgi:hypothetical protein
MITIANPTGRKTNAHTVIIGDNVLYFSYQTLIAFRGTTADGQRSVRISNSWGPTTGRHFREMGCSNFETVTPEELETVVRYALSYFTQHGGQDSVLWLNKPNTFDHLSSAA